MTQSPVKIGIVGCGSVSSTYFRMAGTFEILEVVACADLVAERARAQAEEFGVDRPCTVEELLGDPEIEVVVNLTVPRAHAGIGLAAIEAGKSVYNEKPLAVTREEGQSMIERARRKGVRIGGAPDTFLGGGLQTCRKVIDDGWIGEPVAATAFMMGRGHERWHPDPAFFYQPGGGPMFDMGPYYLTALLALMGPVRRVTGAARRTFAERTITSQPRYGEKIRVEIPTHIAGLMDFAGGAIGTIITSFDVWGGQLPRIEIYGTEGTLGVPDPNSFGGPVLIKRADTWEEMPLSHGYIENSRSIGVADLASALRSGREHRANGELTYHVLDLMHSFHEASDQGKHIDLGSTCSRPAPLPLGLMPGQVDA